MHRLVAAWLSLAPPSEPSEAPRRPDSFEPIPIDGSDPFEPTSAEPPRPEPDSDPALAGSAVPDKSPLAGDSEPTARMIDPSYGYPPPRRRRGHGRPWGGEWRRWGAPLLSTFVPGLGQFANGQPLKGIGLLYGSVFGLAGAVAIYKSSNDGTRPVGAEYARLIGYGTLSTAAPMLWILAIADAWRVARDREVEPHRAHKLRVSLARSMTVGFRADPDRPGFYDEWTMAFVGQVARRVSVGVTDLTLKPDGGRIGVVQLGARVEYRVFDRPSRRARARNFAGRVWIDVGLGSALQLAIHRPDRGVDPDQPRPGKVTRFGAVPYGQVGFRWFVLDRLSLDLVPRISVPVTTRYYSANRALPRFAPTLELGASVSAYF